MPVAHVSAPERACVRGGEEADDYEDWKFLLADIGDRLVATGHIGSQVAERQGKEMLTEADEAMQNEEVVYTQSGLGDEQRGG